jgi:GTP-binding protein
MRVREARFLKSAEAKAHWPPDDRPEVAIGGRSNVGKSSLINALTGRKALARVSSTPGRTRHLNFMDVTLGVPPGATVDLRLCDLPGYGFARAPKTERRRWGPMIEQYIETRARLALVIHIVDSRHPPTDLDLQMVAWLDGLGRRALVVATKIDKIGKGRRGAVLQGLRRDLGVDVVAFSAVTGEGRDGVWERVAEACRIEGEQRAG